MLETRMNEDSYFLHSGLPMGGSLRGTTAAAATTATDTTTRTSDCDAAAFDPFGDAATYPSSKRKMAMTMMTSTPPPGRRGGAFSPATTTTSTSTPSSNYSASSSSLTNTPPPMTTTSTSTTSTSTSTPGSTIMTMTLTRTTNTNSTSSTPSTPPHQRAHLRTNFGKIRSYLPPDTTAATTLQTPTTATITPSRSPYRQRSSGSPYTTTTTAMRRHNPFMSSSLSSSHEEEMPFDQMGLSQPVPHFRSKDSPPRQSPPPSSADRPFDEIIMSANHDTNTTNTTDDADADDNILITSIGPGSPSRQNWSNVDVHNNNNNNNKKNDNNNKKKGQVQVLRAYYSTEQDRPGRSTTRQDQEMPPPPVSLTNRSTSKSTSTRMMMDHEERAPQEGQTTTITTTGAKKVIQNYVNNEKKNDSATTTNTTTAPAATVPVPVSSRTSNRSLSHSKSAELDYEEFGLSPGSSTDRSLQRRRSLLPPNLRDTSDDDTLFDFDDHHSRLVAAALGGRRIRRNGNGKNGVVVAAGGGGVAASWVCPSISETDDSSLESADAQSALQQRTQQAFARKNRGAKAAAAATAKPVTKPPSTVVKQQVMTIPKQVVSINKNGSLKQQPPLQQPQQQQQQQIMTKQQNMTANAPKQQISNVTKQLVVNIPKQLEASMEKKQSKTTNSIIAKNVVIENSPDSITSSQHSTKVSSRRNFDERSLNSEYTKSYESEVEDVFKDLFFLGSGTPRNPGKRAIKYQPRVKRALEAGMPPFAEDESTVLDDVTYNTYGEESTGCEYTQVTHGTYSTLNGEYLMDSTAKGAGAPASTPSSSSSSSNTDPLSAMWSFMEGGVAAVSEVFGMAAPKVEQCNPKACQQQNNATDVAAAAAAYANKDMPRMDEIKVLYTRDDDVLPPSTVRVSSNPPVNRVLTFNDDDDDDNTPLADMSTMTTTIATDTEPTTSVYALERDPRLSELAAYTARSVHEIQGLVLNETDDLELVTNLEFKVVKLGLPLGILFQENGGGCWVAKVFPDGNAAKVLPRQDGVWVGDQLAAIDGHSAIKMKVEDICKLISEAENTRAIELTFMRYTGPMRPTNSASSIGRTTSSSTLGARGGSLREGALEHPLRRTSSAGSVKRERMSGSVRDSRSSSSTTKQSYLKAKSAESSTERSLVVAKKPPIHRKTKDAAKDGKKRFKWFGTRTKDSNAEDDDSQEEEQQ